MRQRGFVEGRRATSHPHLLDEPQHRPEVTTPQIHDPGRRNSHGNLLDHTPNEHLRNCEERESDDGGFRARLAAQGRSSYEERTRISGRSVESQRQDRMQENVYRRTPDSHKERRTPDSHKERRTPDSHKERRTPDIHKERRTPDSIGHKKDREEPSTSQERNDESASQKSADSVYNSSGKTEAYNPQPSSSRQTPNRIEDLKAHGKKGAGSGASSGMSIKVQKIIPYGRIYSTHELRMRKQNIKTNIQSNDIILQNLFFFLLSFFISKSLIPRKDLYLS